MTFHHSESAKIGGLKIGIIVTPGTGKHGNGAELIYKTMFQAKFLEIKNDLYRLYV